MKLSNPFLLVIYFLLSLLLVSCPDDHPAAPSNNDNTQEILESKSADITSVGGLVTLSDGTQVVVPSAAVENPLKVTISKLNPKGLFSSTNSLVYDLELSEAPLFLQIDFKLKLGLSQDDISVVRYKPDENCDEISGSQVDFIYDSKTGIASSIIIDYRNEKKNKKDKPLHELLFPRFVVEWNENIEGTKEEKIIEMPYYTQPGGTCVLTAATMLTKAYTPYKNRKNEYEICDFLKYLNIGKNDGVPPYTFLFSLNKAFHQYTGAGVETAGYFLQSSLLSKIIEELDKDHPLIMRMDFPGVGKHAILIIGYEKITSGSQQSEYNLIYHNSNLTDNMYSKNSFEWLMSDKSYATAYQLLYPTNIPHKNRSLQTLGMPLKEDGYIKFKVPKLNTQYYIDMDYDKNADKGYSWFDGGGREYKSVPDTASTLEMSLPVWNADRTNSAKVRLRIQIDKSGVTKAVYLQDEDVTLPVGKQPYWFKKNISLTDFVKKGGENNYTIIAQVWSENDVYLDGFSVEVKIENEELLYDYKIINISFNGAHQYDNRGAESPNPEVIPFDFNGLTWQGVNFSGSSVKYDTINYPGYYQYSQTKYTVSGNISKDGKRIENINAEYIYLSDRSNSDIKIGSDICRRFSLKNIPQSSYQLVFQASGAEAQNCITEVFYKHLSTYASGEAGYDFDYLSTDFNGSTLLKVTFGY